MDKKYLLIGGLIIFAAWYFFKDDEKEEEKDKVYTIKADIKEPTLLPVVRVEPIVQHYDAKIYIPKNN